MSNEPRKHEIEECKKQPYFLIAHTAKIVAKIFRRRIERKIEDVLGEEADKNIRTNLGGGCGSVCLLHRLAKSI
jgi:hypothetical protein